MKKALSLVSKIQEKGNRFIIEELNSNGIKWLVPSHGDILQVLYVHEKLTMKEIANKIRRTKPTVTVLIDKLEKLGYVERLPSNKDSRYTCIILTEQAKNFKPVFDNISKKLNDMLYRDFTDEETQILEQLLEKMMTNIEK